MPANQHQTLSDLPLWLFLMVSLAGLAGEMWRAEAIAGLSTSGLIKRIVLRCGASGAFGMFAMMIAIACGAHILMAGGIGGIVACIGADIASSLYARWLSGRLGIKHDEPA